MSLYNELQDGGYLDPEYGMVSIYKHNGPGRNCDNYWFFTAIAMELCGFITWPGLYAFYRDCKVDYGLMYRFPKRKDDVSQQELAGCAVLNPLMALEISTYGHKHFWCFNAVNPGVFSFNYFYARFIDFVPFIKAKAKQNIFFTQFLWAIGVITTTMSPYDDTSEKVYKWLQVENMRSKGLIPRLTIRLWSHLMQRKYPGGPKELFNEYFPSTHPFIRYAPEKF